MPLIEYSVYVQAGLGAERFHALGGSGRRVVFIYIRHCGFNVVVDDAYAVAAVRLFQRILVRRAVQPN